MKDLRELIEAVRPYLPGLPPEVEVVPWERVRGVEEHHLGLAFRSRPALSLHPDLEGEALERVLLHELLHLAEPLLSEPWVRALEPVLHHALRNGLSPRDVPSLAWLSLEEASSRLLPDLPEEEETDPLWFPGRLGPFYRALGVVPERELAEDPLYLFQQVSGGLPFGTTAWALERLWPPPAMTRREAALAIAWWAALATEKAWAEVERLLGRDGEMAFTGGPGNLHPAQLWYVPVPEERRKLTLSLVDAVLQGEGEAYEPPEVGLPEEVVAGLIATGRLEGGGLEPE